jgi:hypothetical protein
VDWPFFSQGREKLRTFVNTVMDPWLIFLFLCAYRIFLLFIIYLYQQMHVHVLKILNYYLFVPTNACTRIKNIKLLFICTNKCMYMY